MSGLPVIRSFYFYAVMDNIEILSAQYCYEADRDGVHPVFNICEFRFLPIRRREDFAV